MGPAPNTNPSGSKEEELGPEPPVNMSEGTCFLLIYTHLYSLHAVIKLRIQFILDLLKRFICDSVLSVLDFQRYNVP